MAAAAFLVCCLFMQAPTPEVIEHAQAGTAALQKGQLDVAIQEFRKVTELQPESASGHANLGDAYFQKGQYKDAVPELEHALQINPNLIGTHQTLGVALLVQGNPEGALPHLEKTHMPELLGLAYLETGRLGSAIMALQAALEREPNDPDLLYYFGRATAMASARTAEQLAKLSPAGAEKNSAAGNASPPEDIVKLQQALAGRPNDPELLAAFSRAAGLASKKAFDSVLQSAADSARAHQVRAERLAEDRHLPQAEQEYVAALRLKPYTAGVYLDLGGILAAEGKWPAAAEAYRLETDLQPLNADAFYRLGSAFLQLRQPAAALESLAHADRLTPDNPQILLELGRAAAGAGDSPRAESSWKQLLSLEQGGALAASAHLELSTLYRNAGKADLADREMSVYQQLKQQQEH